MSRSAGGGGGIRRARLAEAVRAEVSQLIARELRDPRIEAAGPTVTLVELNVDYTVARIGVTFVVADPAARRAGLAGLAAAAAHMRGPLGRRLRLRVAPELRFFADESIDLRARLDAIVRDDAERAAAAQGAPAPSADAPDGAPTEAPDEPPDGAPGKSEGP